MKAREIIFCCITISYCFVYGWTIDGQRRSSLFSARASVSSSVGYDDESPFNYTSEVVGASGRVGSFWLCHREDESIFSPPKAAVVPRGLAPGCQTTVGCPIYVATPGDAWASVWESTLEERRQDLVFVGNGIPPDFIEKATLVIPHFSILKKWDLESPSSTLGTSPISPPTYIYGKHAQRAATILQKYGVSTKICQDFDDMREVAIQKLMWASCMWLLCHAPAADGKPSLTVGEVHTEHQMILDRLVDELFPKYEELVGHKMDRHKLGKYLHDYSMSIASAVPSVALGKAELSERNGIWLTTAAGQNNQTFHKELLTKVVGEDWMHSMGKELPMQDANAKMVHLPDVGLAFHGRDRPSQKSPVHVSIVGGGILGTSLALALKRRRIDVKVTVLEKLPPGNMGRTTPASWAWLNANGKSPKQYQILNQLGLHAWKRQTCLSSLVAWSGSLVRFHESPQFTLDGGYPAEGPLSPARVLELEPLAKWRLNPNAATSNDEGYTYFFRDEGCVDPAAAVCQLREDAIEEGVNFLEGMTVTSVSRDATTQEVRGVRALDTSGSEMSIDADLVVVAAGAGSAANGLECGFELLSRPGAIVYISPKKEEARRLSRILVDPLRSSHVLQRPDGSLVAGGGALEVGGTVGTVKAAAARDKDLSLLEGASQLAPEMLHGATVEKICEAVRPMPVDGLPIIGHVEKGLYSVVTHSGITLGPLLASMAAGEILDGVSISFLTPYRPQRFAKV